MNNFSNSNTGKFEYTEYAKNFLFRAFQHAMQANLPFLLILLRRTISVNKVCQMISNNSVTFTKETYGMTGMIRVD